MKYLLLVVLCLMGISARAADQPAATDAPVTDPAVVRRHYQELLARPEFREPDDFSADLRFRDWISQWVTRMLSQFRDFKYAGEMSGLAWLLITGLTGLAIVGLIYVLIRLSRRKGERANDEAELSPAKNALLSPQVYDQRLRLAVENRDWHGAWLATWLQFLARLENRRMVEADRSRTNREYLAQLRSHQLPAPALPLLARLVDDYDRFIYGWLAIDEPLWRSFRQQIDEVSLMLHLRENDPSAPQKTP
jgi:hypothetical protein